MARRSLDCRTMPSERNCTVQIAGEEDEVLELAVAHAVAAHGHTDSRELREGLRAGLRDEEGLLTEPGSFLQLIEFHARDLDGFGRIVEDWRERMGREATARWGVVAADRDRANLLVVGYPNNPTGAVAAVEAVHDARALRIAFRNLDVERVLRM